MRKWPTGLLIAGTAIGGLTGLQNIFNSFHEDGTTFQLIAGTGGMFAFVVGIIELLQRSQDK